MEIIRPVNITDTEIVSTNATPANSGWLVGTAYSIGQLAEKSNRVYEALAASTGQDPDTDTNNGTQRGTYWLYIGATNSRIMFDYARSGDTYQTVRNGNITVQLEPNQGVTDRIAFFAVDAGEIRITVTHPVDGIVYPETTFVMIDNSSVIDMYTYLTEPFTVYTELIVDDLPMYGGTTIDIVIDNGTSDAKCGKCVVGQQKFIGDVVFGTEVGITSYSAINRDFGQAQISPGDYNRTVNYKIGVATSYNRDVQKILTQYRDTPIVFIGSSGDFLETTLYGVYKDFKISIDNVSISSLAMSVEEL